MSAVGCASGSQNASGEAFTHIGVYDSRAVAVAYAGTKYFNQEMSALQSQLKNAQAEGDQLLVNTLEAQGVEQQRLLHMQVFSTYPVDDILENIQDKLPVILEQAGVDAIISKWDEESLTKYSSAEQVDVTMLLVDALEPNAQQRQFAIDIQNQEPIPLEQAEKIQDW
jgi:hypothetical protein